MNSSPMSSRRRWSPFHEDSQWVIQIQENLAESIPEDEDDDNTAISIFNVPEDLRKTSPTAYDPQVIALGPYHHWKPELHQMQQYKLSAARRFQERLASRQLHEIAKRVNLYSRKIRGHYLRYVTLNDEALSWMMVVDGCFLLEFLQVYTATPEAPVLLPRSMMYLYSTDMGIIRDVMKLENQLPLFLLQDLFQIFSSSSNQEAGSSLEVMLTELLKNLTPFKSTAAATATEVAVDLRTRPHAHLLDILYHTLVPALSSFFTMGSSVNVHYEGEMRPLGSSTSINEGLMAALGTLNTKPLKVALKVPWAHVRSLVWPTKGAATEGGGGGGGEGSSPSVEEILIPSVTELAAAGVHFKPTDGGLNTISFDQKTATFWLPVITLDTTTEVVLRNLVAFEAAANRGPLVLARYTELMNGIIDTEDDACRLRQSGIISNHLKSDLEVTELWNGMSKSIRLTKVKYLDAAIRDVNAYYDGKWKVKVKKAMSKYVYRSWKILALLATLLLLALTTMQTVCTFYNCNNWIKRLNL